MKTSKTASDKPDSFASVWDAIADTPEQAANLRARAELMRQIAAIVKDSGWTQAEAAGQCGVTQPRMNDLLRGRVSRSMLWNIATAIGRTVHFDLRAANKADFGAVHLGASLPTGSDRPTPSRSLAGARGLPKVETIRDAAKKVAGRTGRALDLLRLRETLSPVLRCSFAHRRAAARCRHAHAVEQIKGRATGFARYDSGRVD